MNLAKKTFIAIGFYLLSFTWGILMTTLGVLVALALLITGHKPHLFHYFIYFEVGRGWGGFGCGPIFVVSKYSSLHTKQHEAGHGIQNIIFGPIMPLLISIPSCLRYWLREFSSYDGKRNFAFITFICVAVTSMLMSTIGFFFCPVLMKIFNCVTVYIIPLFIWLLASELPKYADDSYPLYDSIWIEGMATNLGKKYYT